MVDIKSAILKSMNHGFFFFGNEADAKFEETMGLPFEGVTICKKPISSDLEKTDISDDHHGRWASSVSEILEVLWISFNPEKVYTWIKSETP